MSVALGTYTEMNPSSSRLADDIRSIYLAGRIEMSDWRHTIVQGLRDDVWDWRDGSAFPVLPAAIYGRFDYVGPYWPYSKSAPDHYAIPPSVYFGAYFRDKLTYEEYMQHCRDAIARSDLVAAVFDDYPDRGSDDDWYVASQLFYAHSLGKRILSITHSPFIDEFVEQILSGCDSDRNLAPRISLGRQLGLTDLEIDQDSGCGFVYFIEAMANRHIKIGWANDPNRRLREFQTGSPTKYALLGTIPGSRALERKLHRDFHEFHAQGEWFFGVKPLRNYIEAIVISHNGECNEGHASI